MPLLSPSPVVFGGRFYGVALFAVGTCSIFAGYAGSNGEDNAAFKAPVIVSFHFLLPGYKYRPISFVIIWQSSAMIGTPMVSISDFTSSSVRW